MSLAMASDDRAAHTTPVTLLDGARVYYDDAERPTTIAGPVLAVGATPAEAAEAFLRANVHIFGVARENLLSGSLAGDAAPMREIMLLPDGTFRHTIVSFTQQLGGVPVFESELRLLVRNEPEHPLVLAASTLKPLGDFHFDPAVLKAPATAAGIREAQRVAPELKGARFGTPSLVIWAGEADVAAAPKLALKSLATRGVPGDADYAKQLVITDAADGSLLLARDMILRADITGTVRGMATEGYRSATCNPESAMPLPFARITAGTTIIYADGLGNFTLPRADDSPVNLTAGLRGQWFRVFSPSADAPGVAINGVTPPGPADFLFNPGNASEQRRSEVNAYIHANFIRSQCLLHVPNFPTIGTQPEFRINVHLAPGTAFYDFTSVNFGRAGSGIDSLAMADVVEHEYGHHLVDRAGSGQGHYGEGYGDLMALLYSDSPINGRGYDAVNCNSGVRTADNNIQHPCSNGDPHFCGQLLTGSFWELRDELLLSGDDAAARLIMRDLAYNSVLLHTGTGVTPAAVTEVVLALDDDDANVNNGTPHVREIQVGFGRHNMDVNLPSVLYEFPDGLPAAITPDQQQVINVRIHAAAGRPAPATARIHFRDGSGEFAAIPLAHLGGDDYTATIPALECDSTPSFYFGVNDDGGRPVLWPATAPAQFLTARVGSETEKFSDNAQFDQGLTVSGAATQGAWARGVPAAPGTIGAPMTDADGSGSCWLTGNNAQDVDGGATVLTTPRLDAVGSAGAVLSYSRWYYNSAIGVTGADTFLVEASGDDGLTWRTIETVGPSGSETHGGWIHREVILAPELATDALRVRFTARDTGGDSPVEAGVDAIRLAAVDCNACVADFNHQDGVTSQDFFDFLDAFFKGASSADVNRDGSVNSQDFFDFLDAFFAGC